MPVFTDKPAELMVNVIIVMITSIVVFVVSMILMKGLLEGLLLFMAIVWLLGATFLYLGKMNLTQIE
jgi:hypothetical protein